MAHFDWVRKAYCKICMEYHVRSQVKNIAQKFDAKKFSRSLEDIGCDAVVFEAVDEFGNSLYDTNFGLKHPYLKRDLLREITEVKKNLKIIAYYCLFNPKFAERYPDWAMRSAPKKGQQLGSFIGKRYRDKKDKLMKRICWNSPFFEEIFFPQIKEIASYRIEGLFFDFFRFEVPCYCKYCRNFYWREKRLKIPLSQDDSRWIEYTDWMKKQVMKLRQKTLETIKNVKPDLVVGFNWAYTTYQPEVPPRYPLLLTCDIDETKAGFVEISLRGRYWASLGIPFEIMTTRFQHWWVDWTLKPITQMKQECATVLATGGTCNIGDAMHRDGMLEPAVLKSLKEVFSFIKERQNWSENSQLISDIAVLHSISNSKKTGNNIIDENIPLKGIHKALVENGLNFLVINEVELEKKCRNLRLLILPDQHWLDKETLNTIKDFVNTGGNLIATNLTSLGEKNDFQISDLLGIKFLRISPYNDNYIMPLDPLPLKDVTMQLPIKGGKRATLVELKDATEIGKLIKPAFKYGFNFDPPEEYSGYPAITLHRFGKGKVIYISPEVGEEYYHRNILGIRHLLGEIINFLVPQRMLKVEAPPAVETFLSRQNEKIILHLVNHYVESGYYHIPMFNEQVQSTRNISVELYLPRIPSLVQQQPEDRFLEFGYKNKKLSFYIPSFLIHSSIIIE